MVTGPGAGEGTGDKLLLKPLCLLIFCSKRGRKWVPLSQGRARVGTAPPSGAPQLLGPWGLVFLGGVWGVLGLDAVFPECPAITAWGCFKQPRGGQDVLRETDTVVLPQLPPRAAWSARSGSHTQSQRGRALNSERGYGARKAGKARCSGPRGGAPGALLRQQSSQAAVHPPSPPGSPGRSR